MNDVIFSIDNGQDPIRRNQFIQLMMAQGVKFRQCIGSYQMQAGGEWITEWAYRVSESDFIIFIRNGTSWTFDQEAVLRVSDDGDSHMITFGTKGETSVTEYIGQLTRVTQQEALLNGAWTFDINRQEYFIAMVQAEAPVERTAEVIWEEYLVAHRKACEFHALNGRWLATDLTAPIALLCEWAEAYRNA